MSLSLSPNATCKQSKHNNKDKLSIKQRKKDIDKKRQTFTKKHTKTRRQADRQTDSQKARKARKEESDECKKKYLKDIKMTNYMKIVINKMCRNVT